MRRLFWRVFVAVWVATVAVLVAFAWLITSDYENARLPGSDLTRLQAAMSDLLRHTQHHIDMQNPAELRTWLNAAGSAQAIRVYIFDAHEVDLLGREPTPDAVDAERAVAGGAGEYMTPHTMALAMTAPDGAQLIGVAVREGNFLTRMIARRTATFWANIGIALLVSALAASLIAGYVAAPLTRIRTSARRFAAGDLDARVGEIPFGRSAEVVALAREFDRMAERIMNLIESHRRLVRDVSHEMRSPLARLRVALELARDGDAALRQASLDRIESEADRLEAMLAQALELSRLEAGRQSASEVIALDDLLENVITNAAYEGAPRGRKVVLAECAHQNVVGSRDALYSALENVVRNALAFTADGTTVSVRMSQSGPDGRRVMIAVRDHGPGVPENQLERIFEPFFRTDTARTRASGGTGLGLAIAWRAIHQLGGTISAKNADGGGLLVQIELPAAGTA